MQIENCDVKINKQKQMQLSLDDSYRSDYIIMKEDGLRAMPTQLCAIQIVVFILCKCNNSNKLEWVE